MKVAKLLAAFILLIILIGCEEEAPEQAENTISASPEAIHVQQKVHELEQDIAALQQKLENVEYEKQLYPAISNMAYQFVQARVSGDANVLQDLLAENLSFENRDGDLYVTYPYAGEIVEWRLYQADSPVLYQGMVIQGFQYDAETETYRVYIREFYTDLDNEMVSPPTFLNLVFQPFEGQWKVVNITFDV